MYWVRPWENRRRSPPPDEGQRTSIMVMLESNQLSDAEYELEYTKVDLAYRDRNGRYLFNYINGTNCKHSVVLKIFMAYLNHKDYHSIWKNNHSFNVTAQKFVKLNPKLKWVMIYQALLDGEQLKLPPEMMIRVLAVMSQQPEKVWIGICRFRK